MASEKKSPFTRPQQPAKPVMGPEADKWIAEGNGPTSPQTAQQPPADSEPEAARGGAQSKGSPKPEPMKRLTIDIPESLHRRVKARCGHEGTTIADVVRKYLEKKFPEEKPVL